VSCGECEKVGVDAYEDARANSLRVSASIASEQRHHGFLQTLS